MTTLPPNGPARGSASSTRSRSSECSQMAKLHRPVIERQLPTGERRKQGSDQHHKHHCNPPRDMLTRVTHVTSSRSYSGHDSTLLFHQHWGASKLSVGCVVSVMERHMRCSCPDPTTSLAEYQFTGPASGHQLLALSSRSAWVEPRSTHGRSRPSRTYSTGQR